MQVKKRGNPGYFLGAPLDLLESHFPKYRETAGSRSTFWSEFLGDWYTTYPATLTPEELEQVEEITAKYHIDRAQVSKAADPTNEPADNSSDDDDDVVGASAKSVAQVASKHISDVSAVPAASTSTATGPNIPDTATVKKTGASADHRGSNTISKKKKGKEKAVQSTKGDSVLTEEENVLLARAAGMKKLKSWFSNRLTKERANKQKDLEAFINQLNEQALGRPPRVAIDFKFYECHPDFSEKVSREYQARFPEASNADSDHLKNHAAVAKALLNAESEETKDRLKREAEAEHAQAVAKYAERKEKGIFDMSDPELLERYTQNTDGPHPSKPSSGVRESN
ncbi:hypothetical protein VKT23_015892 [Stygiomarasmius scandens]|uniref:Uncharacterized protein n=1 Tax=Marasmiellus scandens TaxID=2682957 RepID=A0ABR1IYT1_9AGAR